MVFAIKASGAGPLAKGDLYASDQMRAASLLSSSSSYSSRALGIREHVMMKGLVEVWPTVFFFKSDGKHERPARVANLLLSNDRCNKATWPLN